MKKTPLLRILSGNANQLFKLSVRFGHLFLKHSFFLVLIAILPGCEGYRCATGIVKDKLTNLPIDSAYIEVISGEDKMYTDSTGKFEVCNQFGGCVPDCKDIMVTISKPGYQTQKLHNPNAETVVLME